ncbi:hypothetical protein ACJ41O_003886 [Fusarium nematophilum]
MTRPAAPPRSAKRDAATSLATVDLALTTVGNQSAAPTVTESPSVIPVLAKNGPRATLALSMSAAPSMDTATTKDFYGTKTVKRPSCSKGGDMQRVVGYFEGWAKNRPCEVFWPEQIPIGLYTHINFAFGTINPSTFQIEANEREDQDMYQRLMLLKNKDKNLKIYLAIGGWTFNDPGPTAKVFSDLAALPARQRVFFNSVVDFMAKHKFDGLDLDWEYPVAEERAGREVDYKNFPVFMAALRKVMGTTGKGLTITLPASYWYLQYFDIKKLASRLPQ